MCVFFKVSVVLQFLRLQEEKNKKLFVTFFEMQILIGIVEAWHVTDRSVNKMFEVVSQKFD
jgi:hypothetical protein